MLSMPSVSVIVLNIIIFVKLKQKVNHNKKIGHVELDIKHHHHRHNMFNMRDMRAFMCILSLTVIQLLCNLAFSLVWTANLLCNCVSEAMWDGMTWVNYSNALFNPLCLLIFHEKYKKKCQYLFSKLKKKIFTKK